MVRLKISRKLSTYDHSYMIKKGSGYEFNNYDDNDGLNSKTFNKFSFVRLASVT